MPTRRISSRANLVKARHAKKARAFSRRAAAGKRTKMGQSLKKTLGKDAFEIGTSGMKITKTIPINQELTRNIGQPTKLKKTKKITIISRRDQPAFKIKVKVNKLDRAIAASGQVSSSWISYLEWNPTEKTVTMGLLDGWNYVYKMKFKEYTGWYYANSKGTYWHVRLKKKYYSRYINKYKL